MRVVVGIHHLELGGSQLNALDLATGIRDRDHDVHVVAPHSGEPGPVADMARDRGLPLTLVRHPLERTRRACPCRPRMAAALTRVAARTKADVVHGYEYSQILDALYGPRLTLGVPTVATVYGMGVPSWLPRDVLFTFGTRDLVDAARGIGLDAHLIVPPVDTAQDDPDAVSGAELRLAWGIHPADVLAVVVSRLEPDMKEAGIARTIEAVRAIDHPSLRVVVVGSGPSEDRLRRLAARVNDELGRTAIQLPGAMADPRPAYAAADVSLGMGGSALRALAFGKPLIVLGANGFSLPFDATTSPVFGRQGFYGTAHTGTDRLPDQLRDMLDGDRRTTLGRLGREAVLREYSLDVTTAELERLYGLAARTARPRPVASALRCAAHRGAAELASEGLRARIRPWVAPRLNRVPDRASRQEA